MSSCLVILKLGLSKRPNNLPIDSLHTYPSFIRGSYEWKLRGEVSSLVLESDKGMLVEPKLVLK